MTTRADLIRRISDLECARLDPDITAEDDDMIVERLHRLRTELAALPARKAWALILTEYDEGKGYVACLVTEDEPGYQPARGNGEFAEPWYLGKTENQAKQTRDDWNQRDFGLNPDEASDIKLSTLTAQVRQEGLPA